MLTELPFLSLVDCGDRDQVDQYEKMFYQCFIGLEKQALIRKIWCFDDAHHRLKTKIPYDHQSVYRIVDGERVCGCLSLNILGRQYQFSEFHFDFPFLSDPARTVCEVLTLFAVAQPAVTRSRWHAICRGLFEHGFSDVLATTAERPLLLYRRLGFSVIGETTMNEQRRYLIHMNLKELVC